MKPASQSFATRLRTRSSGEETTLTPRPQQAALLPAPVALLLALALVVQLLAFGHRQQQLGAAAFVEIQLQRYQRHAVAVDRAHQLVDLLSVQQHFSRPLRPRV